MGTVYAEITLKNAGDVQKALDGLMKEQEIRQVSVTAMVDTGAGTLVIDETTCQQLGLGIKGLRRSILADNSKAICKMTMPVEVHWKDRNTFCEAMVLPDTATVLLGAIPLGGMDLMVNPVAGELVGVHGDEPLGMIL
ncbi:MAG: retropepsin-like domain-containing protein [Treponema sp.]|jgi:clan AA aspartic protease|nr:retropepsin-like domain-containing protein [Treponema sp.]